MSTNFGRTDIMDQGSGIRDQDQDIPVIFYHEGNQEYLNYALRQAEKFNKTVILL